MFDYTSDFVNKIGNRTSTRRETDLTGMGLNRWITRGDVEIPELRSQWRIYWRRR